MTLYAQSGHVAVIVSSDGHGGCGQVHTRPVDHGKPASIWALTCPACEDHLRHDPTWASSPSKIPETPDQVANREELEKSRERAQQDIMVQSLQVLAGNVSRDAGPQAPCVNGHQNLATARFCTECGAPVTRPEAVSCADGHESPAGARFCVECGRPVGMLEGTMRVPDNVKALIELDDEEPPAVKAELPPPPWTVPPPVNGTATVDRPPPPAPKRAALPSNTKMRGMKREDLLKLAATAGVDGGGTREQVLTRLIAYNNA